jgi:UTP--glucose-1-phosphate uridylyltransferase
MANIHYIRQKEPKGLGHAIWCARKFITNEPFAVLLGDDIVLSDGKPCLKQLIDVYDRYHASVVGVKEVDPKDVSKYGIVAFQDGDQDSGVYHVESLVEKPPVDTAPSNLAIMGRYILHPEIFAILEHQEAGAGGEIQLTDALNQLNQRQTVLAYKFEGTRYDIGDKFGFIQATLDFALNRDDLRDDVLKHIRSVVREEEKKGVTL